MTRWGSRGNVHLWEEPIFSERGDIELSRASGGSGVTVLTPLLPHGLSHAEVMTAQRSLLDSYLEREGVRDFVAWYYTPMALGFSSHLQPDVTVYDCMDELSAFHGAPPELIEHEQALFSRASVVFAGGASLYGSKRTQHGNVHLFPSSIDRQHFAIAREPQTDPADQAGIPHPRIGFFGVLDERLDRDLLRDVAAAHPEWHFVLIGPVVKIRQEDLPQGPNLHYLGQKHYTELPLYLSHWDVAMLPFARNEATRFISPTKTPEYLAAGKPVVSTPITDVVKPYGELGLVKVASNATEFGRAIEESLQPPDGRWLENVDRFLAGNSWDQTFEGMLQQIQQQGSPQAIASAKTSTEQRSGADV